MDGDHTYYDGDNKDDGSRDNGADENETVREQERLRMSRDRQRS